MPVKLVLTDTYRALKENLSLSGRRALRWVERGIEQDPSLGLGRLMLEDGAILDTSVEDMRVVYRILSAEQVLMELVFDERNL